jgi:hypothetical protein
LEGLHFNIDEMLVSCRYNELPCSKKDFKLVVNEMYGNCYVFNSNMNILSSKYGSKYGLMLELFIGGPKSSSPV